jgi:predicted oxidoreductase
MAVQRAAWDPTNGPHLTMIHVAKYGQNFSFLAWLQAGHIFLAARNRVTHLGGSVSHRQGPRWRGGKTPRQYAGMSEFEFAAGSVAVITGGVSGALPK